MNNSGSIKNSKLFSIISVLKHIRFNPFCSVQNITKETGIVQPTVYRSIRYLLENNIIVEKKDTDSIAGRKARLFLINKSYKYISFILINKKRYEVLLADLEGSIISKIEKPLVFSNTLQEFEEELDECIESLVINEFGDLTGFDQVILIGVGVAGIVEDATNKILTYSNVDLLKNHNLAEHFKEKYDVISSVMDFSYIEGLANANEFRKKNISNYIFIHIGEGIGSSIVINNKLYHGSHGMAGQFIGTVVRERKGENADGFDETRYNIEALFKEALRYAVDNKQSYIHDIIPVSILENNDVQQMKIEYIEDAIKHEDKGLIQVIDKFIEVWTDISVNCIRLMDPGVLLIGGEISESTPGISMRLKDSIEAFLKENKILNSNTEVIISNQKYTLINASANLFIDHAFDQVYKELSEI